MAKDSKYWGKSVQGKSAPDSPERIASSVEQLRVSKDKPGNDTPMAWVAPVGTGREIAVGFDPAQGGEYMDAVRGLVLDNLDTLRATGLKIELTPDEQQEADAHRKQRPAEKESARETNHAPTQTTLGKKQGRLGGITSAVLTGTMMMSGAGAIAPTTANTPNAPITANAHNITMTDERRRGNRREAFTLTELVVCVAIVAILAGLTLPAIQRVRTAATNTQNANMMKQLGLAIHNFESDHGKLPLSVYMNRGPNGQVVYRSGIVDLLPYLEQGNLHAQYNQSLPWNQQSDEVKDAKIPILNPRGTPGGIGAALVSDTSNFPVTDPAALDQWHGIPFDAAFNGQPGPPNASFPPLRGGWSLGQISNGRGTSNTIFALMKQDNEDLFLPSVGVDKRRWGDPRYGHGRVTAGYGGVTDSDNPNLVHARVAPNAPKGLKFYALMGDGSARAFTNRDVPYGVNPLTELMRDLANPRGQSTDSSPLLD